MTVSLEKTLLLSFVSGILLLSVFGLGYCQGHSNGTESAQKRWEQIRYDEQAAAANAYRELLQRLHQQAVQHQKEQEQLAHELEQSRKDHAAALDSQRSAYEQRLLLSENRISVYQRQAEAGAAACRDLASHAARLDRSLERGRHLVRKLGSTVRLRDRQLTLLGKQIHTDRQMLMELDPDG